MGVTVYSSSDVGAPSLTGLAGTLINVLDGCLVNGYGSKASVGWSKVFTGTNKAAYRASIGNRFYFRILDDNAYGSTDSSYTSYARIQGYESMSDVDNGMKPFPTFAQFASPGLVIAKTYDRNSVARPWYVIADEKFFIFVSVFDSAWIISWAFGDFPSYVTNDSYNTLILAMPSLTRTNTISFNSTPAATLGGLYVVRRWDQFGEAVNCGKLNKTGFGVSNQHSGSTSNPFAYPNLVNGRMYISPQYIQEMALGTIIRGKFPGIWYVCHSVPNQNGDIIQGVNGTETAGRTFMYFNVFTGASILIEISDTWYI